MKSWKIVGWVIIIIVMEAVLISQIPMFPRESLFSGYGTVSQLDWILFVVLFSVLWVVLSLI